MPSAPYVKRVTERDVALLSDLYRYRLLTTDQIRRRHFPGSRSYVDQKLHAMRNSRMISSFTLRGSRSREGKKGITCHRITDTGITCLRRQGIAVEGKAYRLKVSAYTIPYVLAANDLMVELTPHGWRFQDSRSVKRQFNLNQGDYIHGMLTDPEGKGYGLYILEEGTLPQNLGKIISEIRDAKHPGLQNFLLFAKGADSYYSFINRACFPEKRSPSDPEPQPLVVAGELKVVPFKLGKALYKEFPTTGKWLGAAARQLGARILPAQTVGADGGRASFGTVIEHEGKEKYMVSLFDSDLMMMERLRRYNREKYEQEGRRVAVITGNRGAHSAWIGANPFLEFYEITPERFMEMCHSRK